MVKVDKIMVNRNEKIYKLSLPTPYPVGDVNVFVVKGDVVTLFDTGCKTQESKAVLEKGLKEIGLHLNDIEQIMLTHHHLDHYDGLEFFEKDVPVYGHKNNQRWLQITDDFLKQHNQFFLEFATQLGVPETLANQLFLFREDVKDYSERVLHGFIGDGDELPGLSGWKAIETLGHAQSHLSFYYERDGAMIGGDQLLATVSPNPIMEPPLAQGEERPYPLLQFNDSFNKLLELPISIVYTGHGRDVKNIQELINEKLSRQHDRAMQVKEIIKAKSSTGFDICQLLFPKLNVNKLSYKLWETVGQLDYLENVGEIKRNRQSGVDMYSIV